MFDFHYISENDTPVGKHRNFEEIFFDIQRRCRNMTENKKFQIIGDGVILGFYKAFDPKTKGLKKKLWRWYNDCFQFTRCEYDKELDYFKVYYKDSKAKELGTILRHFSTGDGIDLNIFTSKSSGIVGMSEKFIGSEYLRDFDGLTSIVYEDFFKTESKTPLQVVENSIRIKSIVECGKVYDKLPIESFLQEYQDPRKQFLGSEVK